MHMTLSVGLLIVLILGGCSSEDADQSPSAPPVPDAGSDMAPMPSNPVGVDPDHYELPIVPAGTTVDTTVAITNIGDDTVELSRISHDLDHPGIQVLWAYGDRGRSLVGINNMNEDNFAYPIEIDPGVTFRLIIEYRATDAPPPSGTLTVEGSFDGGSLSLPVEAIESAGSIAVDPPSLDFGRVRGGTEETRQLTISNTGGSALNIRRLLLDDISTIDFSVTFDGEDARGMPEFLNDPDGDGQPGLAPGEAFELDVRYAPNTEGTDQSVITIDSDDPLQPAIRIPIAGNTELGCAEISPEVVDVEVALGTSAEIEITVASCSVSPLTIDRLRMRPGSPAEFVIDPDTLPAFPTQLTRNDDPIVAQVTFTPSVARRYTASVQVETNDPDFATVAIPINAFTPCAMDAECPPGSICMDRECIEMIME